jgi:hypothetical protein
LQNPRMILLIETGLFAMIAVALYTIYSTVRAAL